MSRVYRTAVVVVVLLAVLCVAAGYAASKTYHVTGLVKSVDGSTFTVEKTAKETWRFETSEKTEGVPKVGETVTVHYKMMATEIEPAPEKPATTTSRKK